ncbi:MAG TPA: calcium-binding protein [Pararhizobium sp.]|uniref:calcium-binding protein n=1 Tax=Pararhizobium sp. TaxID=1977563 RepID=UPI002D19F3B0|nr:calcium-binding protein [Pararhizobium sp.]HTO34048.1 calcium-binding protein [Pararhizobium sp.]
MLIGGEDADYLDGGRNIDTLSGGIGNDTYVVDNASDVVTEAAGDANDMVFAKVSYALSAAADVERLAAITDTATTAMNLTGNNIAQIIQGNNGTNNLKGLGGGDTLRGLGGNDTLDGGTGIDTMIGGTGNDTYIVENTLDVVDEVNGGGGIDLVKASVSWTLGTNQNNLTLTGAGQSSGTGNSGSNVITGNAAHNVLNGGGGFDTFVFNTALDSAKYDIIGDFNHAMDTFNLENAAFIGLANGNLASGVFKVIASANSTVGVDGDDRILYDKAHGDLYFDRDGSGATYGRVKFAEVANNSALDHTDFFVI